MKDHRRSLPKLDTLARSRYRRQADLRLLAIWNPRTTAIILMPRRPRRRENSPSRNGSNGGVDRCQTLDHWRGQDHSQTPRPAPAGLSIPRSAQGRDRAAKPSSPRRNHDQIGRPPATPHHHHYAAPPGNLRRRSSIAPPNGRRHASPPPRDATANQIGRA